MLIITSILITKMSWNVEKFRNFEYFQTDSNFSKQKLGNVLQTAVTLTLSVEYTPLLLAAVLFSLEVTLGAS